MTLLSLYEKLEKLVRQLPEALQSPILREIRPLQSMFLLQRPPRLLLLGDRRASRSELVNALTGMESAKATEDLIQDGAWQTFSGENGKLRLLDARRPASMTLLYRGLAEQAPDLILFAFHSVQSPEDAQAELEQAAAVLQTVEQLHPGAKPNAVGIAVPATVASAPELTRHQIDLAMHGGNLVFARRVVGLADLSLGKLELERLAQMIAAELPFESKLAWVHLAGLKREQVELANTVVKSVTAICGAVGSQPIPFADFPILTSLQAAMVAGIMHIAGRPMKMKLAGEWLTALGANIGVGLAFREGARAVLKLLPVWGDFLSGSIAAAGTFAIGKAAIAYFIEGVSFQAAQKLFQMRRKERALIDSMGSGEVIAPEPAGASAAPETASSVPPEGGA